jgi:NADH dehydrogenase [ubiquinone] 1 alpha subcomplex assembly factor 7
LTQTQLLGQLGINARVEALLENASEEQAEALEQEYLRLVGDHPGDEAAQKPPGMGARYKAVVIAKKGQGPPFPFT